MFTGIVQEMGLVRKAERADQTFRLTLEAPKSSTRVKLGDSVAVNGCCLTVVEAKPPMFSFEAVPETLGRTALGSLSEGSLVNLELPLTLAEPLGGHLVQGHVDGVGRILGMKTEGQGARMRVALPDSLERYVIEKGSIALDGVSLTVASVEGNELEVALIPHTFQNTNLGSKKVGDPLQVEADMVAKYLEKLSAGSLGAGERT
jgi:riboflavin synthase